MKLCLTRTNIGNYIFTPLIIIQKKTNKIVPCEIWGHGIMGEDVFVVAINSSDPTFKEFMLKISEYDFYQRDVFYKLLLEEIVS